MALIKLNDAIVTCTTTGTTNSLIYWGDCAEPPEKFNLRLKCCYNLTVELCGCVSSWSSSSYNIIPKQIRITSTDATYAAGVFEFNTGYFCEWGGNCFIDQLNTWVDINNTTRTINVSITRGCCSRVYFSQFAMGVDVNNIYYASVLANVQYLDLYSGCPASCVRPTYLCGTTCVGPFLY